MSRTSHALLSTVSVALLRHSKRHVVVVLRRIVFACRRVVGLYVACATLLCGMTQTAVLRWAGDLGVLTICLIVFFAGCAPVTSGRSPWFGTATIGTVTAKDGQTYSTDIRVRLGYTGDITNLRISVSGPDGYSRTETLDTRRSLVLLQETHYGDAGPLGSGTYHFRVTGDGGDETWTIDFDATAVLRPPSDFQVQSATTSAVTVTWDLVPQARSYEVVLWERTGATSGQSIPPSAELVDPATGQHTFANLNLDTNGEYWVTLRVFDGVNRNDPSSPPRQINSAHHETPIFAPAD